MSGGPRLHRVEPAAEYYSEERCHILELANDPEDPPVSIARARVEPGVTTRVHRVRNTVERYVIIAGNGRVEIEGMDVQEVGPEDVVEIPAGARQCITNVGDADLIFLCICTPRFEWGNYEAVE